MKDKNKTVNLNEIQMLLGKYFDATISPMEMARLDSIANDVESGKLKCHDTGMAGSLHFINTFSKFAEKSLDTIADNIPAGLEERMNSHISMLAAKTQSRRRISPFTKIASISSAAVVAAIIAFAGFNYLSKQKDFAHTPQILIAGASLSYSETNAKESSLALQESEHILNVTSGIASVGTSNGIKSHHQSHLKPSKPISPKHQPTPSRGSDFSEIAKSSQGSDFSEIAKTSDQTFSISEETFKVMPSGILASVDPVQILMQPITTLSQSINNIYESVETVSEALSGVSVSLRAVSNSLALLSEPI